MSLDTSTQSRPHTSQRPILKFLDRITTPSPHITDPEAYQQARFLSMTLLLLSLLGFGISFFFLYLNLSQGETPDRLVENMGASASILLLYFFSRTRYVRAVSYTLMIFLVLLTAALVSLSPSDYAVVQTIYLIVPVLIAGILSGMRTLVVVTIISTAAILILLETNASAAPLLVDDMRIQIILTILVVFILTAYRTYMENQRRKQLVISRQHLAESQQLTQLLIENVQANIYYLAPDGTIILSNTTTPPGTPIFQTYSHNSDDIKTLIQHVTEQRTDIQESIQIPGDINRWEDIQISPIIQDNQLTGLTLVATDITARKDMEQARQQFQQQIIDAQKATLKELSTPIIPLTDRVIILPLVGSIDTQRSQDILRSLLAGITEHRARVVIIDITGVAVVDSGVAAHLNKTIQAARLKGAHTIVTGMSDAVAETIVELGIDWHDVQTMRDLQSGLSQAMTHLSSKN